MKVYAENSYDRLRCCLLAIPKAGSFRNLTDAKSVMFDEIPNQERVRMQLFNYRDFLIRHGVHVVTIEYDKYPNQVFMRDLGVVVGDTFYLGHPYHKVRHGEHLVLFRDFLLPNKINYVPVPRYFEGADVLVRKEYIVAAVGNRTHIDAVASIMSMSDRHATILRALPERVPQHLLGHKQILDNDLLLSRHELMEQTLGFSRVLRLSESEEVTKGFAANIFVLGPSMIVMPTGCPNTKRFYEENGLTVHEIAMDEVHKMGGGLTCITLPLVRMP